MTPSQQLLLKPRFGREMSRNDPVLYECNVYLDKKTNLMVFRLPETLKRREITEVKAKINNQVFEIESPKKKFKSRKLVNETKQVVCQFREDGLHMMPIESIHEFQACLNVNEKLSKTNIEEPEVPKAVSEVTQRFAGPDEEERRKAREGSFVHHREVVASEPWIQLNYETLKPDAVLAADEMKLEPEGS